MSEPWLDYTAKVDLRDGYFVLETVDYETQLLAVDYESACEALRVPAGTEIEGMKVRVRVFLEPQR